MPKHESEFGSVGARTNTLRSIRQNPDYYTGALIDEAATAALNVGRPARRNSRRLGTAALQRSRPVGESFAAVNDRWEQALVESGAEGWDENEDQEQPPQTNEGNQ